MTKRALVLRAGIVAAAISLALTGCAPGSAPKTNTSADNTPASKSVEPGKYTLVEWDQSTNGGIDTAQAELNREFEKLHPNITIKRNVQSFQDLKTTLKLALSGKNPPDVIQANQGYPDMGAFVSGGLLTPLNKYAALYGWKDYYPSSLLDLNTFSANGKNWQTGNLYGVSQTGEYVGVYYNKKLLEKYGVAAPTTLDQLTAAMAKVKAAGMQPMAYGDLDKVRGIALYGVVQAALAGRDAVQNLVASKSGAWTDSANVEAAKVIQSWQKNGYLPQDGNGVSSDAALANFDQGKAAFLIDGTWDMATIGTALGQTGVGMTVMTPAGASAPVTQGGEGLAWAMTTGSKHPNAAAAYIDFITGASAADALVKNDTLPVVLPADVAPQPGTLVAEVYKRYDALTTGNGIVPYLDYTTPTFYNTLTAAMQDLTALKVTPEQFTQQLQHDYAAFKKSKD